MTKDYAEILEQLLTRVSPVPIRPPRVALLSTGNELVEPGQPLALGQIYHSNGYMLAAAAAQAGAVVTALEIVPDSVAALASALERAAAPSDLILTTGGTVLGDHDIARQLQPKVWPLALSPVRRLLVGQAGRAMWLGLPGPPGPAFAAFEVFARPVLARLRGELAWTRPIVEARLTEPVSRKRTLRLLWARLLAGPDDVWVTPVDKCLGMWPSLLAADSLLLVPAGEGRVEIGEWGEVWVLGS